MKVQSSTRESENAELAAMDRRGEREAKGVEERNESDVVAVQTGCCQLHTQLHGIGCILCQMAQFIRLRSEHVSDCVPLVKSRKAL